MKLVTKFFKEYKVQLYSNATWFIIKLIWVFYFCQTLIEKLFEINEIVTPLGLCNYLPCSVLSLLKVKIILSIFLIGLSILYVLEKKMLFVLLALSLISIFICSGIDSSGVLYRLAGFSLIMIVQLVAYVLHLKNPIKFNLNRIRVHFSLQIITSLYALSFTSKLVSTGLFWFTQTQGFGAHILKSWLYYYVTTGNEQILNKGYLFYNFIQSHPLIVAIALAIAMFLEGFAFLTIFNSKTAFFWGLGLLSMHLGIYLIMDISILSIIIPMLLFMLNLPAVITTIFTLAKRGNIEDKEAYL